MWQGSIKKPSGKNFANASVFLLEGTVALQRGNSFRWFWATCGKAPFNSSEEKQEKYSWLLLEQSGNAC